MAMEQAKMVKSVFRERLSLENWQDEIDLKSPTSLGRSYERPNIGARFYPCDNIPSQTILEADLREILEIAKKAIPVWEEIQQEFKRDVHKNQLPAYSVSFPKPFIILAGPSGTGKSRWVREQAFLTWAGPEKQIPPINYLLVPVKPNWHDSSELLGYVTRLGLGDGEKARFIGTNFVRFLVKAWMNPESPYWLCLDEMNLAPIEQYFAEFLSVIETRRIEGEAIVSDPIIPAATFNELNDSDWSRFCLELGIEAKDPLREKFRTKGISLPQNLIVVGTVNMDETTHSFSRKVLDRAFVWEMPIGDLSSGWDKLAYPETPLEWEPFLATEGSGAKEQLGDLVIEWDGQKSILEAIVTWLEKVNQNLDGTPYQVSYRVRDELLLLTLARGVATAEALQQTLDVGLYSKILPRIEGDEVRTRRALIRLALLLAMDADLAEAEGWPELVVCLNESELPLHELRNAQSGPAFMFGSASWPADPFAPALPWRRSLNKIRSMLLKLESQFTSYWD